MWLKNLFPKEEQPTHYLHSRQVPDECVFENNPDLSDAEIECFKTHGLLVKTDVLSEDHCKRAVDRCWELLPPHFQRDQPDTWQGKVKDCCVEKSLHSRRGRVKFRECLRSESWVYDIIARNPVIEKTVAALLGKVAPPSHIRGLYPVFPVGIPIERPPGPHTDMQIFQVGTVGYLEDVAPNGGGFTIWPGSHLRLHASFALNGSVHPPGADLSAEVERLRSKIQPWEISGRMGTVIFWHHRLMHTYGFNRTNRVRQAILGDFAQSTPWAPSEISPSSDPWEGWSERIRNA
jgi:hypothetical protein